MRRILLVILAFVATPLLGQTLSVSPSLLLNGSTGNTVTATETGCVGWVTGTPGTPVLTLGGGSGASITAQTVNSSTCTATLTVTAGTANGYLFFTAPRVSGPTSPALAYLTVQPAFVASQPFIVNGTTGNVIALTGIGTSWTAGTPGSPTFALSGCGTASITSQTVTSATTASVTLSAGATDCTIALTDPSTSNTTTLAVYTRVNYYVRTDGGTRYSTNITTGQCDGMTNAAYPGTGVNQHCAFNDPRFMYQDGSQANANPTFPTYGWLMKGGDTLTIVGSIADGDTWRIGWQTAAGCGSAYPYWGLCGDTQDSGIPSPPSGIASQHTVIQGGNAGSCHAETAKTQLHGGWAMDAVFYFGHDLAYDTIAFPSDSDFVDVTCLDVTDFATGTTGGDYVKNGARISLPSHDITFTDTRWHGFAFNGWLGTTGGNITANYTTWAGNASAGWDADEGIGVTGWGNLNVTNYQIEASGCSEEYPLVDAMPYTACMDEDQGVYSDGFGTTTLNSPEPGEVIHFDQGTVDYNTQDGIDCLHNGGGDSSCSVTRTLAYGNMGQQIKIGGGGSVLNNVVFGNCNAMSAPIPGFPSGYNTGMTVFCRAGNTAVVIEIPAGATSYFEYNTLLSQGLIGLEIEPYNEGYGGTFGTTEVLHYIDNVQIGYNTAAPIYSSVSIAPLSNAGAIWTNNATYQAASWTCPHAGESNALCTTPGLTDQTWHTYGYGNVTPASGSSAVVGAGVAVSGITIDFIGATRHNPPTIGAYEGAPVPAIPAGGGTVNGRIASFSTPDIFTLHCNSHGCGKWSSGYNLFNAQTGAF